MLTKKIQIDDVALPIIAEMEWEEDGTNIVGKLTCGQLDRKTYLAVNKGLDALGGKWNRKLGGHVFKTDPRPALVEMLDTGVVEVEKDGYFPTPKDIGKQMAIMAELDQHRATLEPSAGTGELAEAILEIEPHAHLYCGEKNPDRVAVLKKKGLDAFQWDFLTIEGQAWDRIIQNPPFENLQDIDHVKKAYELLSLGGILVSVMSESPFFRNDEKARQFRCWLDTVDHEVVSLERGAFRESGTDVKTRIVIIKKEDTC